MTATTQHKRINSTSHPHRALMPLLLNLKMKTCKGESHSQLVNIMQFISNKHHNIPFTNYTHSNSHLLFIKSHNNKLQHKTKKSIQSCYDKMHMTQLTLCMWYQNS